jgi:hypothetical protein
MMRQRTAHFNKYSQIYVLNGEINLASFCSSGESCRPQKMLKHLLLYSIMKDFIWALGVLNFSKDTLRVLIIAVALGRADLVYLHALTACTILPPPTTH